MISLLDYLYFYDIVAMETFSQEKLNIYRRLTALLNSIARNKFDHDFEVEHYKHLLIVGLDFELMFRSDTFSPKNFKYNGMLNNYRTYLARTLEQAGFQSDVYGQDLQRLLDQIQVDKIDNVVAFKIVSQVLCYEYDNITIGVFSELLDRKFLTVSKARYQKNQQKINDQFLDKLFLRAMLFLEFEVFKNNLIMEFNVEEQVVDLNNLEDYQKILASIRARGEARSLKEIECSGFHTVKTQGDLKKFLINIEERLGHNPIFSDSLANWTTLIGTWHLMLEKKNNLEKPLFKDSPTYVLDSGISCAKLARKQMHDYGFTISEKTIFDGYDRAYDIYTLIRMSVESCLQDGICGVQERILTNDFFYNPNLGPVFREELKKAKAKL